MPDHHNALPAGYRLGEYEIQTVLGSGGFGVTYKAHDHNLDKQVAIKEYLPPEFAVRDGRTTVKPKSSASKDDYAWGLDRFLDEARALARFDHPHINKVYRFFKENGTAYLVLEYVEGDLLSDLLRDKGRFSEAGIRRMLDELLDGLDAVHKAGYIHRDIKPANIMFRRDGSAVLLDFGAARQAIGQRSQMITSILTPGYAPVEQYLTSVDEMGAWSDLYSLGVVAYRCLVGGDESVLIDAPSRAHLVQRGKLEKDMPAAVVVGAGKYGDDLLKAIDWAMKVDERERPQSVGELRGVLAGEVAAEVEVETETETEAKTDVEQKDSVKPASVEASTPGEATLEYVKKMSTEWKVALAILGVVFVFFLIEISQNTSGLAKERASFRQLVGKDASPERVYVSGTTDLHIAAANGWAHLTEWLIRNGANVHARIKSDDKKMDATLKKRLNSGGSPTRHGQYPLHTAFEDGSVAAAKVLVDYGAKVNAKNASGSISLHSAAANNSSKMVDFLLDKGANVDAKDRYESTPLHYAAYFNAVNAAKSLIQGGANMRAINSEWQTPLDYAKDEGHTEMINLLQQSN